MPNPQRRLPFHASPSGREKGGGKAELGREKGLLVSVGKARANPSPH